MQVEIKIHQVDKIVVESTNPPERQWRTIYIVGRDDGGLNNQVLASISLFGNEIKLEYMNGTGLSALDLHLHPTKTVCEDTK